MKISFAILLSIALLFGFSRIKAQNNLQLQNKTFVYEALFINEKSDTVTHETIELSFNENPWKFDKKQQELLITYHTDTSGIKTFFHPFEKTRKKYAKNEAKKSNINKVGRIGHG